MYTRCSLPASASKPQQIEIIETQVSVRAPLPNTACQSIQLQTYMQGANTRREAATACCKQHLGQYTRPGAAMVLVTNP